MEQQRSRALRRIALSSRGRKVARDTLRSMNAPLSPKHVPQLLAERIPLQGSGAVDVERQRAVVARLKTFLPEHCVLWREEDTRPYECDGLTMYRQLPMIVALPATEEAGRSHCTRVLRDAGADRAARRRHWTVGRRDAARSRRAAVAGEIQSDPEDRPARLHGRRAAGRAQPCHLGGRVAHLGLYYAPDPSSQIACTIGGNIAENSGGVHCLKYGLTLHNVLRVRGRDCGEGEIIEVGSEAFDSPGLDLLSLVIGSEGMLLITTEATVKLLPKPVCQQVVMASFDDVGKGGDAVAAVIAAGIIPAGMEMMDRPAIAAVEPFVNAGYDLNAESILLVESDGTREEVGGRDRADRSGACRQRRHAARGLAVGRRASPLLGRPQGSVSSRRPGFAGLLLHGRHDPAQAPGRGAEGDRRDGRQSTVCAAQMCFMPATAICIR